MRLFLFATVCTPLCAQLILPKPGAKPLPDFMAHPRPMIQPFVPKAWFPSVITLVPPPPAPAAASPGNCATPLLVVPRAGRTAPMPTARGVFGARGLKITVPAPTCGEKPRR